jgi:DNA-binding response OmpR family regulator
MESPAPQVRILRGVTSLAPRAREGLVRTVVVIEDEQPIAEAVAARLRSEGYAVEIANDGLSGVALCERTHPDLVVLDLMLPGLDGIEVCKRIQRDQPVPVLMLTARDGETDLLVGLAVGADDYMTKPFSMRELIARVHALLRRAERSADSPLQPVVRIGDVELDATTRRVRVAGELVHLTPIEFDLVHYLAARPGRVSTREELLAQVWGYDVPSGARTVDSHIRTVRRKLGSSVVRTVHGVGYAIEEARANCT